jgi:hypothetical protein
VWLEARNLKLPYLSKKIAPNRTGPFRITEVLSPITYQLELPKGWKIHNVFHSTLLTPFVQTEIHGPSFPTLVPDIIDGQEEYEVEGILKHKTKKGKTHFLIRWKDQPTTEDSWEPEENVTHTKDALGDYWSRMEQLQRRRERTKGNSPKKRRKEAPLATRIQLLATKIEAIRENNGPHSTQTPTARIATTIRTVTTMSAREERSRLSTMALLVRRLRKWSDGARV